MNQKANINHIRLLQHCEQGTYDIEFKFHLKNPDTDNIFLLQWIAMTKQMAAGWEDSLCYS